MRLRASSAEPSAVIPWNRRDRPCTAIEEGDSPMKHQKALERIRAGRCTREDLVRLHENAARLLATGDNDAQFVLDAICQAIPTDQYIVFMGFCPSADFANRLDIGWKKDGI